MWIARGKWAAVKQHLAGVRRNSTTQDLDEGRFAGAVLSDKSVNLTGLQVEVHAVERTRAAERLAQARRGQQGHPSAGSVMRHMIPGRGIPVRGVAPHSHMADMPGRRAWRSGRRAPGRLQRITFPGN
jgi:hypothetical protein